VITFWDWVRETPSRRAAGVVFALVLELLVVLMFLALPGSNDPRKKAPDLKTFEAEDPGEGKAKPKPDTAAKARPRGGEVEHAKLNDPEIIPPPNPPVPPPPDANILWLTKPQYAASDIGQNRAQGPNNSPNQSGAVNGAGDAPGDSQLAEGKGPNGEPIYVAEWYRRPTNAELNPYISQRAYGRDGWGVIVCRTAPNYRVEDCREVDDAPRGSGYAGSVRQASFQFRVRPARKGGKPLIGALVYIRIDYSFTREERPRRDMPDRPAMPERPATPERSAAPDRAVPDRGGRSIQPATSDEPDVPIQ
jgi:protein TonB